MKTPFKDGFIAVKLSVPETGIIAKARDLCESLAKMQPLRKKLSEASDNAAKSLATIIEIAAHDAPDFLPLLDAQPADNAASE